MVCWRMVRPARGGWFGGSRTVHEFIAKRRDSQPLDMPNAGRAFRNPEDNFAARLIQLAGMAGARLGGHGCRSGIRISSSTSGDASASDIERLIDLVAEVAGKFDVRLQCDVRIVGNKT